MSLVKLKHFKGPSVPESLFSCPSDDPAYTFTFSTYKVKDLNLHKVKTPILCFHITALMGMISQAFFPYEVNNYKNVCINLWDICVPLHPYTRLPFQFADTVKILRTYEEYICTERMREKGRDERHIRRIVRKMKKEYCSEFEDIIRLFAVCIENYLWVERKVEIADFRSVWKPFLKYAVVSYQRQKWLQWGRPAHSIRHHIFSVLEERALESSPVYEFSEADLLDSYLLTLDYTAVIIAIHYRVRISTVHELLEIGFSTIIDGR